MAGTPPINQTIPRRLASAVFVVALFFLIMEITLRTTGFSGRADDTRFVLNPEWDYPEFFLKDAELFWKFRPSQVITSDFFVEGEYHINSHGLRGPDFATRKPPGTYRIICLGNSCTFGWRVRETMVYPRQLESSLSRIAADGHWEVINAGVTGYTTLQGLRFLQREVDSWGSNLLVINYCWNDHWAGAHDIADKDQVLPPQWILDIQNLLARTHTYRWLKYLVFSIKRPVADFSRTNPVYRVGPADFQKNLEQMIALAKSRHIPVILLTSPIASRADGKDVGVHAYHKMYNDIIRLFAGVDGVTVIDAAAEFTLHDGLFDDPNNDIKHYNANGHNIIATLLANYIYSMHIGN